MITSRTARGAATPLTTPYDASYAAGRSIAGGGGGGGGVDDHPGTVAFAEVPILAHLDLDAFFAAVEELEEPRLRSLPLVVGGDPKSRGVVATANYVARRFGIHSAMSAAEALRRCPDGGVRATEARPLPAVLGRGLGGGDARSCRESSAPGWTRATSTSAP